MAEPRAPDPGDQRIEHLRTRIARAFDAAIYPGDDQLVMHTSHDLLGEEAELEAAFKGRHWRDLGLPDLQNTEPSGLTPQAFRFYLPAYLLTVLNAYWESDVLPECTVWMLDPDMCAGGTHEKWFAEVIGLLDGEQRAAVRAFLEFMRDEHASDLEGYGIDFDRIIRFYEDFA